MTAERKQELIALGRTIRQVRAEHDIDASELATAACIVPRRLAAIEAGRFDPPAYMLAALARGLDISLSVLVNRPKNVDTSAACTAFTHRLRELRIERGFSQDRLARRSGVHRTEISKLELGEREPRLGTLLRLAFGLDVPIEALVVGLGTIRAQPAPTTDC